ncbi:MAG: RNA polymerase sigma factor [Thermomicrobiales bacterium]
MTAETATAKVEDTELVEACIAGDQDAWAELVEKYARLVYSVARRCGLSEADADDVLQVVFTTLFRRLHGLRDQTRLSSWLITTTYREAWRVGKASARNVDLATTIVDDQDPPVELVARGERDQLVRDAMTDLDERCRDLLTALFLVDDGAAYVDVARRLGMATGSVGPTRARCFKKLETLLRTRGLEEFL